MDLENCFLDSPQFRLQIGRAEEHIAEVEAKAKALSKASRASIEATQGMNGPYVFLCNICTFWLSRADQ